MIARMNESEKWQKKFEISSTFTPSAPIDSAALFAGRLSQVNKLINAVNQRGQHAVLFGERGVGKTSLANVLKDFLAQNNIQIVVASTNCESSSTFQSVWKVIFAQIPLQYRQTTMGFDTTVHTTDSSVADLLPANPSPEDIRQLFEKMQYPIMVIIDEIDRIQDKGTTTAIADTIKTLSDHSTNVTLILVGVADSLDHLISEHRSIERALVQIPMPRMSLLELQEIIDKGLTKVGMTATKQCSQRIARLSHGLPHYTHSLALHSAQASVDRDSLEVSPEDVTSAIETAIEHAQQSIVTSYHQATSSPRGNLYSEVLLSCALAKTDELGYFPASNVRAPMTKIMGRQYDIPAFSQHLNDFCDGKRGTILQKTGHPRRYRFRFVNPLMEPFVVMKGISKKLIEADTLDALAE